MPATDRAPSSDPSKCSTDHIPPPLDPFPTYQTPYPRPPSDSREDPHRRFRDSAENPFVQFRRFADDQFSNFFSNMPNLFGLVSSTGAHNGRDSDLATRFHEQAKEFERKVNEMVKRGQEEAEGFRKKIEQDWEEKRAANARWLNDEASYAKPLPSTELNMYEHLRREDDDIKAVKAIGDTRKVGECPWREHANRGGNHARWLETLGWDGRRRAEKIPLVWRNTPNTDHDVDGDCEDDEPATVEWSNALPFIGRGVEGLDPVKYDEHIIPWLLFSSYSPRHLYGGTTRAALGGHHDLVSDSPVAQEIRTLEDKMSSHLPWADAFEDLMSLARTGKMPERVGQSQYTMSSSWLVDIARRGSLGHQWMTATRYWDEVAGFGDTDDNEGDEFDPTDLISKPNQIADTPQWVTDLNTALRQDAVEAARHVISQLEAVVGNNFLDFGLQNQENQSKAGQSPSTSADLGVSSPNWPSPEDVITHVRTTDSYRQHEETVDHNDNDDNKDVSEGHVANQSAASRWPGVLSNGDTRPNSIVSALTTTRTRTLPDGSIETVRVLKKRFADGSEEQNESTEVVSMASKTSRKLGQSTTPTTTTTTTTTTTDKQTQTKASDLGTAENQERKSGWFWN